MESSVYDSKSVESVVVIVITNMTSTGKSIIESANSNAMSFIKQKNIKKKIHIIYFL